MDYAVLLFGFCIALLGIATTGVWWYRKRLLIELARNSELAEMAFIDPLTGLLTRRAFLDELKRFTALLRKSDDRRNSEIAKSSVSLFVIDIDYFKSVNDTHGHTTGDRVLQAVAASIQESLRTSDPVGRWGGEEIIVAIPNIQKSNALAIAEKLHDNIANLSFEIEGKKDVLQVTASIGGVWTNFWTPYSHLIETADAELYEAKRNGRSQVKITTQTCLE